MCVPNPLKRVDVIRNRPIETMSILLASCVYLDYPNFLSAPSKPDKVRGAAIDWSASDGEVATVAESECSLRSRRTIRTDALIV